LKNTVELSVKVFLLRDIKLENTSQQICKVIDKSLVENDAYHKFHDENKYKNYSFNMLYPLEQDKIYKKENIYTFIIRTVEKDLCDYLMNTLKNQYTEEIKILTIIKRVLPRKHIESVHTITPIVAKFGKGYWKEHTNINELERRISENLIKKYNQFYNVKIDEELELFTTLTLVNKKPVATKYKDVTILGDKVNFRVADNSQAQDIIQFAIGTGLGEMNSRGLGFINYRWL